MSVLNNITCIVIIIKLYLNTISYQKNGLPRSRMKNFSKNTLTILTGIHYLYYNLRKIANNRNLYNKTDGIAGVLFWFTFVNSDSESISLQLETNWKSWCFFFFFCPLPCSLYLFVISCLAQCISNKPFFWVGFYLFFKTSSCAVYDQLSTMPVPYEGMSTKTRFVTEETATRKLTIRNWEFFWSFPWTKCFVFISFSLVVVSRFQPSPIVMALLPRLAPSRPFVVYCQYKEVTCHTCHLLLYALVKFTPPTVVLCLEGGLRLGCPFPFSGLKLYVCTGGG